MAKTLATISFHRHDEKGMATSAGPKDAVTLNSALNALVNQ
jgi:hypothetical protein